MILNFIEFNYFHFLSQMEGFSGIISFIHPPLILFVGMEELEVGRGRMLSFPTVSPWTDAFLALRRMWCLVINIFLPYSSLHPLEIISAMALPFELYPSHHQ